MSLGTSVFQRVRRQMELETSVGDPQLYRLQRAPKRENLQSGQLVWMGQSDFFSQDRKKTVRFSRGEKHLLSPEEVRRFARTPYEGGLQEYVYEGQFRKLRDADKQTDDPRGAVRQGRGTLFYPSGIIYDGNWHRDKRCGVGCISSPAGYRYMGEWQNDVPNGKGYEVFACCPAIDAPYMDGLPEGEGVILYNPRLNAYRYEGGWHKGRRHGKGVIFYANGDIFAGTFEHGKRHGRGVTTQTVNGRIVQYETHWQDNKLVGNPKVIPRALRTNKPVSFVPYRTRGFLTAADITNWTLKEETSDLSFEHFMQLKLGFELLDVVGCGFLPLSELRIVWPEGNMNMLQKLEAGGRVCVELLDIISAWYPSVTPHHIARLMQEFIHPLDLLRIRGFLNGIEDADSMGYYHICGVIPPSQSAECQQQQQPPPPKRPQLHLQDLEASQHCIGGETFTLATYKAACQLHDPPYFLDVLEVWYPNIPRATLEQYETEEIDREIIDAIRVDFNRYAHPHDDSVRGQLSSLAPPVSHSSCGAVGYLAIDDFFRAEEKYREHLLALYRSSHPSRGHTEDPDTLPPLPAADNAIESEMQLGFFRGTLVWVLGNRIRLSLPLLVEVEKLSARQKGRITFDELLRFCFPNVPCLRTQEALLGCQSEVSCGCILCKAVSI